MWLPYPSVYTEYYTLLMWQETFYGNLSNQIFLFLKNNLSRYLDIVGIISLIYFSSLNLCFRPSESETLSKKYHENHCSSRSTGWGLVIPKTHPQIFKKLR